MHRWAYLAPLLGMTKQTAVHMKCTNSTYLKFLMVLLEATHLCKIINVIKPTILIELSACTHVCTPCTAKSNLPQGKNRTTRTTTGTTIRTSMPLPGQLRFNEIHKCTSLKIRSKILGHSKNQPGQLPKSGQTRESQDGCPM